MYLLIDGIDNLKNGIGVVFHNMLYFQKITIKFEENSYHHSIALIKKEDSPNQIQKSTT